MFEGIGAIVQLVIGPLAGLFGTWIQGRNETERRKIESDARMAEEARNLAAQERIAVQQKELAAIELEKVRLQGAAAVDLAHANSEAALQLAALQQENRPLMFESVKDQHWIFKAVFGYIDFITRAIRPHVTVLLVALLIWLNYMVFFEYGSAAVATKYGDRILNSTISMTEAVIIFWFQTRRTDLDRSMYGK